MRRFDNCNSSQDWLCRYEIEGIKSIERGLIDLKEGRIHSHETVRKTYEKYL